MKTKTLILTACALLAASTLAAQTPRAVRRDIPLTNMIRRAHDAGTRDSTGRPGPNYWQFKVDYNIDARLDETTSTISGRENITIHNTSREALDQIVLRLDQNIFRATADRLVGGYAIDVTAGTNITRMTLNGEAVELREGSLARNEAPKAPVATGLATTVARVTLPTPIAAGATATLEIDWNYRVPRIEGGRGLRTGSFADSVFQIAQWYPRVAKYDDLRGWDTELYLGPSEFYNNFGSFDVRIDVPVGWLVGATGTLQNPNDVLSAAARARLARVLESDSVVHVVTAAELATQKAASSQIRRVWHFTADNVNDFA